MLRSRLFTTATSLDLSGIITDETGTGSLVFSTSPTIITPTFTNLSTFNGQVNITDATASTTTATGALVVLGGLGIGGAANIGGITKVTNNTATSNTTTGAFVVTGGVGIGGGLYAGGQVNLTATADSTDKDSGALVVEGGVGIEKNLYVGGNVNITGSITIPNDSITYAKIQNVSATDRILGRSSAGAGDIEEITCTAAGRALLDDANASAQRTTLELGTLATQNGTFSGTSSGTNTGDQTITLTNDVTGSGTGTFAATIANDAVTYAKIQNVSATDRLLGRSSSGAGDIEEITCTAAGRALLDDANATDQLTTLGAAADSVVVKLSGDQTVAGAKTFSGITTVSNTTESTTKDTGALVVEGGVGIEKRLNVGGNAVINSIHVGTGTAAAPTSNTVVGNGAGAALQSTGTGNVMIGFAAGDAATINSGDIAIGSNALGSATTAVGTFTTTPVAGGTGYTANQTGVTVTLVKKSGTSTFGGTVQASLTTDASGVVTAVAATPVSRGSLFTGSNIILEPTGFGAGSGCEISVASLVVCGENVAIGASAAASLIPGPLNQGRAITAIGSAAGSAATTQQNSVFVGTRSGHAATTGGGNTCVGSWAGNALSTGSGNTIIGGAACGNPSNLLTGSGNVVIGGSNIQSGYGPGSTLTSGYNNILIGNGSNAAAGSDYNSVVISGGASTGNGSNTTTIGNSNTTGTFIPAGNLTLSNGNLILGTVGNGISFAATSDPTIPAVAATGAITRTATNVSDGDTVTIGTAVYTFKTALTPADYEVLIGADAAASLTNLANAINGTGGTPGTDYQVPAANASASAGTIVGSVLPLTALTAGTAGNSIALAETSAQLSVSAATLRGGLAAGSVTSEILSDYEEGTWNPRYAAEGATPLADVSMQVLFARYVRVGKIVHVSAWIRTTGLTKGSASAGTIVQITGLPYAAFGGSGIAHAGSVGRTATWAGNEPITVEVIDTWLYMRSLASFTSNNAAVTVGDLTESNSNANEIAFQCSYPVA